MVSIRIITLLIIVYNYVYIKKFQAINDNNNNKLKLTRCVVFTVTDIIRLTRYHTHIIVSASGVKY